MIPGGVEGSIQGSDYVLKHLHNWVGVFKFIDKVKNFTVKITMNRALIRSILTAHLSANLIVISDRKLLFDLYREFLNDQ